MRELKNVKSVNFMCKREWIDFNHLCNLFLVGNDKALPNINQSKKFGKFSEVSCESASHYPDKVICNFSSHKLTEVEKPVLSKGLQFALQPKRLTTC